LGDGEVPVLLCNYVDVYKNERIKESTRFMAATASENERLRFKICKNDVLITKDSEQWNDIGVPALVEVEDPNIVCGYHLAILRPRPELKGGYLHRAIESHFIAAQFHVKANGVTRYGLSHGAIQGVVIPLPPPDEQAAIVRFLDHANRRIQRYIRAKQKLIKLLEEQKQAIIHQAVTRGLDPNVPMKDSGVDWIGEVPQHWGVKRLKWVTHLQRGYDLPANKRTPGSFPVVSSGGFIDTHNEPRAPGPGVVMGRYGSTGSVFYIDTAFWPHNTSLFVNNFHKNNEKWCYYLLRTISTEDHSGKSAVPGVDRKDLFEIFVPAPPPKEQKNTALKINEKTKELSEAINLTQRQINLLRELRTRLIADVVTGQLDVRAAAAALPDEPAEDEPIDEVEGVDDGDGDDSMGGEED
jgi:type I restriction enzyme S subunit